MRSTMQCCSMSRQWTKPCQANRSVQLSYIPLSQHWLNCMQLLGSPQRKYLRLGLLQDLKLKFPLRQQRQERLDQPPDVVLLSLALWVSGWGGHSPSMSLSSSSSSEGATGIALSFGFQQIVMHSSTKYCSHQT